MSKIKEFRVDSLLTSYQVGALLQVNPSSVNKWVKDGRIPAFRTPGGHRRIRAADLVAFLTEHKMPIPKSLNAAARRRVLVVEHSTQQLERLQRDIGAMGDRIEVVCVNNGVDAMVQVGAYRPHVIILDAEMPNFDSFEVCRRLKSATDTSAIAVLLSCQTLTADLQQRASQAGAKACVQKPIDGGTLAHVLGLGVQAIAS